MNYQPPQPGGGAPPPGGPPCACGYFPTGQFCEQCGAPNQSFQGGGQPPFPPPGGGYDQGGQPQFPPGGGYDPNQPQPGGQPPFPPSPGGYDPNQGQQPGGYPSQPQHDPYGGGFPGQPQQDPYGGGFDPNQGQQPGGYPSQPQFPPPGQPSQPQHDPYGGGFPGQQMSAPPASAPPGVPSAPFQQPTSAPPGPGGYSIPDAQPHDPAAAFPPPGQGYGQQPGGGPGTGLQWVLVATADRAYFSKVAASEEGSQLQFPDHYQPRRFPLDQAQVNVGRFNARRGTTPQIDLSGEASDPGVSSQHALLQVKPDGTWSLIDTGSSNGTFLNGADDPLPAHAEMPVGDGSYFHVGAWTRLTLHYEG